MNRTHYHSFEPGAGANTCGVMVNREGCLLPADSEFHRHTVLKDVLPREFMSSEFDDSPARKYAEEKVLVQHDARERRWPGSHKNVTYWWELENGYAVAFNENPARGWSFPVLWLR